MAKPEVVWRGDMEMNKNTIIYIRNVSFLKKLGQESLTNILSSAVIKSLKKDEMLFIEGDVAKKFYVILNGTFKLYNETINGIESVKHLLSNGDFFGERSLSNNPVYNSNAEATRDSQILEISSDSIKTQMQLDNKTGNIVFQELLNNQFKLESQIEYLSVMNATQRIGRYLIDIIAKNNKDASKINLQHDKCLIATFLGMKPETFSRSIKKLENANVYVNGAEITIKDYNLLQRYCEYKTDCYSDEELYKLKH